ncbi:MAG: AAA family ATPase [Chitinophagales bacterium]|nr:AAA family ATPase [Chitinophagales bacterium]
MSSSGNATDFFKLKSIRTFAASESLMGGERKFRKVFDESEVAYIYPECALYNKKFDEEDWVANVEFKIFNNVTNAEVAKYTKQYNVSKETNILLANEGWGNEAKTFWKKGTYRFEFYVNNVYVGNTYFYIVNYGVWTAEKNPYFNVVSMKLYHSGATDAPKGSRTYLSQFKDGSCQYVNIELTLDNLILNDDHNPIEFQFNIYTSSGYKKGFVEYFYYFNDKRKQLEFSTGYGSTSGSYFSPDDYTFEVLFMGKLFAVVPFKVGSEEIVFEGTTQHVTNVEYKQGVPDIGNAPSTEITFEDATKELYDLIGLEKVKKEITELSTYLKFIAYRKEQGFDDQSKSNLNLIFSGNPGTGKTTVANMLGKIYKSLGLLTKGHVHEVGRPDLVGEYIGQTAPKVKKAIEDARGGILFIDEAYSLTDRGSSENDYGKEVLEVLIKEMSDGSGNIAMIFAGYTEEMEEFVFKNPGLKSRIGQIIHFDDYTPDELMQISAYAAKKKHIVIEQQANELIQKYLIDQYRNRDKTFGNARLVNGIMEEAKQNMALRLMMQGDLKAFSKEDLALVKPEDIQKFFDDARKKAVNYPVDEAKLQIALTELKDMVGLNNIKTDIEETVKLVKYYNDIGKDVRKAFSMHMVFTGSPGTGKTTVARIVVEIFKSLGILERGHLVECDRQDLVAGYVGQTAIKTDEMVNRAMGGGLFIDEAYSLTSQGGESNFGKEAVETLLKRMEDDRGKFMVIAAGYTGEMRHFLESNPGLMSRFDKTLHFEDFSVEELVNICIKMLAKENLLLNTEAELYLIQTVQLLIQKKSKFFGNARTMRKLAEQVVKRQNLRMAEMSIHLRTPDKIREIILDDIKGFTPEEAQSKKSTLGFGAHE